MTSRRTSRKKLKLILGGGPLNILEFSPKGINKAYALNYLLKAMRKSTDDLIAFGDEHNDTEMLELAKTGYAMKNASSVLLPTLTNKLSGLMKRMALLANSRNSFYK